MCIYFRHKHKHIYFYENYVNDFNKKTTFYFVFCQVMLFNGKNSKLLSKL